MIPTPHVLRRVCYGAFYRLPMPWRRLLIRMTRPGFLVGSLVLVYASENPDEPQRLLLVRQAGHQQWSLPGGLLERGEQPIECAARELAEEVGLELAPPTLTPCHPNAVIHPHGRWVDCVFSTWVRCDTTLRPDGAEVHEAAFHHLDHLPELTRSAAVLLSEYGVTSTGRPSASPSRGHRAPAAIEER